MVRPVRRRVENEPVPTLTDVALPALPGGSPGLYGVLGVPDGDGPWPAVVVVHEAFGVDEVMRRQVQRLASAGHLALMPDLFVDGGPRRCLRATFRAIATGEGRAFLDVEAARRLLQQRVDRTGGIGLIGFCMGGGFALMAAQDRGFSAVSANYARLPKPLDERLVGACPVVASYGGRDLALRGAAGRLEAALARQGVPHDVKEYPTAGHGFLDESLPAAVTPLMNLLLGQVLHFGPDPEAAKDAWQRIDAFFAEQLVGAPPEDAPDVD
jgi:carboxymethylenebutenolidase